ncbi:MAG: hypothetical protein ACRBCI_12815 [Cellvibrionaceae bacterium]
MPYAYRDNNGSILSLTQTADGQHQDYIPPTDKEVIEFLMGQEHVDLSKDALAESDRDIARVTEDLINLLISKNLILFTELPEAVQQKLLGREKLRSNLNGVMENFLDDDESI